MCPLRQCDAELAAEKWGLDKRAFIMAVYDRKVVGLAALPTTLFFLLAEFREGGGFSGTHRELYERGCQRLAREVDPRRTEALRQLRRTARVSTPQEISEAASRLAALFLLCGKASIHIGTLDESNATSDLHISEAADTSLTEDVVMDTIASGLFTSRGPNRFGFAHQTFAECLAAQFISRLPLIQIRSLLCARDAGDEYVVPQLAETAAWVAGAREDFFDYLCRIEPEVLLRSDVSKVQNQRKSALVAAILEKAKRAELFDERNIGRFFDALKHPGLAVQLRSYITDKSLHSVVRRMALSIAGDCKVTELTDDLLRMIHDATEDQHIRNQAANAAEDLIPESRLAELIPLALGQVGADPDDDIRACAMRRLVPALWSVSQALPAIRAPRNSNYFGSHWAVLKYHLPHHLKESDLQLVLGRLIRWTHCFDSVSQFEDLAGAAFAMALKNLDKRSIRRLAVRVWSVKQKHFHPLPRSKDSPVVKLFEQDENLRRMFVAAIINDQGTAPDDYHVISGHHISIFLSRDLEWALSQITQAPAERRAAWANVIWSASQPDVACKCWDLLLQRIEELPELKDRFAWLRAWDLGEPMARKAKAHWLKEQRWKKRWERPERKIDVEGMLKSALDDIAVGKTFRWIQVCELLALKPGETQIFRPLGHDLIEFPGWKTSNEARQKEIRAAARLFLLNHSDGYAQIGDRTNYFEPGYIAVWLLHEEVRKDAALKTVVATNWIEALLGQFNNGSDHFKETAALAYELNPDATLRGFIREMKDDDRQHGEIYCLFGFRDAWDSHFTTTALDLIREGNLKARSIQSLLTFVGPLAPNEAAVCAKEMLAPTAIADSALHERKVGVLTSCLGAMPAVTWNFAWPIIESDLVLAEEVLLQVADRFNHDRKKFLPTLSEKAGG